MRTFLHAIVVLLVCAGFVGPGEELRRIPNNNFARGEHFTYLAHYGFLHVGEADITLDQKLYTVNSRPCYKVEVDGRTIGTFSAFQKVHDRWLSYIDTSAIIPHQFYRDISENKYKLKETTFFDHKQKKVRVAYEKGEEKGEQKFDIPTYAQDLVSGYYFLRTVDFSALKSGDIVTIPAFFENKSYDFQIKFVGRGVVKTKFGKIHAFEMRPIMPDNDLFDGGEAISVWISDDANRVPLKVRAKMFIGSFEVELTRHEGLKTPFNVVKK